MGKKKKKKKVYRIKDWDNIDPVKFYDVSNQEPYFPGIDWLGVLYYGETFFDDNICTLFTVYDMEGRRYLTFHLKGSNRYLFCRFRMRILNKLKKNVFTAQRVFTQFTKERFMVENFKKDNYHDDEIVTQICSYEEWLLYNFPDFELIKHMIVPEQVINKENKVNQIVEDRREWTDFSNIQQNDIYFDNLMYLGNLYYDQEFLYYEQPLIFTLKDIKKNLYLCIYTDNPVFEDLDEDPKKNIRDKVYIDKTHYCDRFRRYTVVRINEQILDDLIYQKLTLFNCIKNASDRYLITNQGNGIVVQNVEIEDIPDYRLPGKEAYL